MLQMSKPLETRILWGTRFGNLSASFGTAAHDSRTLGHKAPPPRVGTPSAFSITTIASRVHRDRPMRQRPHANTQSSPLYHSVIANGGGVAADGDATAHDAAAAADDGAATADDAAAAADDAAAVPFAAKCFRRCSPRTGSMHSS